MEVLSVGEKIKRARIYKGYTLKDVCGEEISVSKLSCIENGKIDAEDWILQYISDKLSIDLRYLKQGVDKQICDNVKQILKKNDYNEADYEEELLYNLNLAEKYEYYDMALEIIRYVFENRWKHNKVKDLQKLIGKYYDLSNRATFRYRKIIYYMDVGKYFYKNKEYYQAANYFENVIKNITGNKKEDHKFKIEAMYFQALSYLKLSEFTHAYEVATNLKALVDHVDKDLNKANIYRMMGVLSLRLNKNKFEEYESKAYELYKDDFENKAKAMYSFATTMCDIGLEEEGKSYIKEAIDLYPKDNIKKSTYFMLKCVEKLIMISTEDFVLELSDQVLNRSIKLDKIEFIEKAYYLKARILIIQNNLITAEMYMNLSLDALNKFGSKREICDRYMEMGKMYYDMEDVGDSIKYFALAMSMQKKL